MTSHHPLQVAVANELRVFGIYDEVDSQINEIVEAPTQEDLWYNIFIRWWVLLFRKVIYYFAPLQSYFCDLID